MVNKMENKNDVTMEKNYTVYMHISPNGKRYIGITSLKPKYRWQNGKGYKRNGYFYNAIQKYNWNNFEHIIIENNLTKEQAENMEIELIAKYRSNDREYGYNIENGGNTIGTHSITTRKKISESRLGEKNHKSKKVFCDNLIFNTIIECSNYYGMNSNGTMTYWLNGKNKMPLDFQQLNLRYATNDDINKYERYDSSKHGDKSNVIINNINIGVSKLIHCDNLIFNSIKECSNYYGIINSTMTSWINGNNPMNSNFQKLNLRYATNDDINKCEKYDINKHGDKSNVIINNIGVSKLIHCDNLIFNSIKECSNYYGINRKTLFNWLNGKNKMPLDFQQLNLRYATNDDINKCEKYDINKHGDKCSDIKIRELSKNVHCDGLIFNSIRECSNYYGINRMSMSHWLRGKYKMPLDFQQLNLRYATNEDLDTYPRYTLANN